ncbi:hypothetical protein FLLO111716_03020 [Flavobacterium longum]|uniref:T9SS type A sorting domain-containing protein n=1 Tax=Flavobacterium longum TaxID=1299340 RepID=UPI0039ECB37F
MKKIYLLVTSLIVSVCFSQNTYIPNPEFEQALIDLGYDSGAIDHYVPSANIAGVTTIDLGFEGSLEGLEDFTSLIELHITNPTLESLDLTNNVALQTLTIYSYSSNFDALDLSQNTALTTLEVWSASLNDLDLSQNTNLNKLTLYCLSDFPYSYDISALSALEEFKLSANITQIDVAANAALKKLDVTSSNFAITDTPIYFPDNNALTTVWLSAPIANDSFLNNLPMVKNMVIMSNAIESFDSTPLPALKTLHLVSDTLDTLVVSGNPALEILSVGPMNAPGNLVEALDVTQNTELKALHFIGSDAITNLDVSHNLKLELLNVHGGFSTLDISHNIKLKELAIGYSQIDAIDTSQNQSLETFRLYHSSISSVDLSQNPLIYYVMIADVPLTEIDLANNPALQTLALREISTMTNVDLGQNPDLVSFEASNTSLTNIDLSNNPDLLYTILTDNVQLNAVDLRNGNNEAMHTLYIIGNPELHCVYVDDAAAAYMNNDVWLYGFYDGNGYANDEAGCALSTDQPQQQQMMVTPNPASDYIIFGDGNKIPDLVTVYDMTGKIIARFDNQNQLDVSSLSKGIYLVRIQTGGNESVTKLVKL